MHLRALVNICFVQIAFSLSLTAFSRQVEAVIVTVTNDINPEVAGSMIEVDKVKGKGISPSLHVTIMPGESKKVSPFNINSFVVSRVFGDYKLKYEVQCPTDRRVRDSIKISLTDIDKNKLPSGCVLGRRGRWSLTDGTSWEKMTNYQEPQPSYERPSRPVTGEKPKMDFR